MKNGNNYLTLIDIINNSIRSLGDGDGIGILGNTLIVSSIESLYTLCTLGSQRRKCCGAR